MKALRTLLIGVAGTLVAGALVLGGTDAWAVLAGATLVSCDTPGGTGGTDVGDAKFSPGFTTVERKQVITSSSTVTNCTANEAALDEIANESKFGVTITAAGGRPAIGSLSIKAKFTTYADCLGVVIANDPDETGEYPASGTLKIKWLTAGGLAVPGVKTTSVMAQLDTSTPGTAVITGIVTKGLGVGGDWSSANAFLPVAADDSNGNLSPDFIDCAVNADPTAVAKLLDVTSVDGAGPELTLTLP